MCTAHDTFWPISCELCFRECILALTWEVGLDQCVYYSSKKQHYNVQFVDIIAIRMWSINGFINTKCLSFILGWKWALYRHKLGNKQGISYVQGLRAQKQYGRCMLCFRSGCISGDIPPWKSDFGHKHVCISMFLFVGFCWLF